MASLGQSSMAYLDGRSPLFRLRLAGTLEELREPAAAVDLVIAGVDVRGVAVVLVVVENAFQS